MSESISINVTLHGWLIKYFDYKKKRKSCSSKIHKCSEFSRGYSSATKELHGFFKWP